MKARLFSWLLVMLLVFESIGLETVFASEKGAEPVSVDTSVEEDVTITSTDVPYYDVEWYSDVEKAGEAKSTNPEYQVAMVLDVSGSMSGTPLNELKKACLNFIDDILNEDETAEIAIVTFESDVKAYTFGGKYFTSDRTALRSVISSLDDGGSTAMNAGIRKADEIMNEYGTAPVKFVFQMADGAPNVGTTYSGSDARYAGSKFVDPDGNEFTYTGGKTYENAIYNTFLGMKDSYNIFSLGFFHSMSGTSKQFAATFLNDIQNMGYHEVVNANDLSFSLEDIADTIGSDYLVLNKSNLSLSKGDSEQLAVAFTDAYTSEDKTVKWGSSDVTVARVNTTGYVTAVGEGTCDITATAGGHMIRCRVTVGKTNEKNAEELKLHIYENQNGSEKTTVKKVLSVGASVVYNGNTYKSGDDGCVTIPTPERGEIVVSKSGYASKTYTADKLKDGMEIVLEQLGDNPVVNAVWINNVDVLTEDYSADLLDTSSVTIKADIVWGKAARKKVQLAQEATFVDFPQNSNTLTMVLKDKFNISESIYLIVTDEKNNTVKKELKLKHSKSIKGLDKLGISFGDGIELNLPEKLPLVGGKGISLDIPTGVPISASIEGEKVYVAIGLYSDKKTIETDDDDDDSSSSNNNSSNNNSSNNNSTNNDSTNNNSSNNDSSNNNTSNSNTTSTKPKYKKDTDVTNFIKDIKGVKETWEKSKADTKKSLDDLKNIKKKYKDAIKTPKGNFGFSADFTILGYAEGYINESGQLVFLDSGLIMEPSVTLDWSGQFAIGPVPCYWEAQIKAAIQGQMNLLKNPNASDFLPSGKIAGTLAGSVGAGIGINKVATIGGGGTLTFEPSVTFYPAKKNYMAMTTTLNAYFKVKVLFFEYKWEPDALKKSWTVDNGVESVGSELVANEMYDQTQYVRENLSYLNTQTASAAEENSMFTILKANAYSQSEPKLVDFGDGTKLAVWVDAAESDVNSIRVYYSFYDGSHWSTPAVIDEDGTPDFSPEIHLAGKYAYVTWQNIDRATTEEDDLDTLAEAAGIKVAVFNSISKAFETEKTEEVVSANSVLDMMPVVTGNENTMSVVWVRNTDNNWYGESNDATQKANGIYARTFKDGAWSDETALYTGLNNITGLAADYDANKLNIAYCVDEDGNLETPDDVKLWLNAQRATQSDATEVSPQFANHELYWYSDGMFRCMEDVETKEIIDIKEETVGIPAENYQVVGNKANKTLVYTVANDISTNFYGIFYNADKNAWGQPICLTDLENAYAVSEFSATVNKNKNIDVLCNRTEILTVSDNSVSEDSYGQTDVAMFTYEPGYALEIKDCYFDSREIVVGSGLPLTIELMNSGAETIDGLLVQIFDQEGNEVHNVELNETLSSGEIKELDITYIVQASDIGKSLTVECTPLKDTKGTYDKNACEISLGFEDLEVSGLGWGRKDDTTVTIYGSVKNNGYTDVSNVKASLHLGTVDGEKINEYTISEIKSMDRGDILFHVPYKEGEVYYVVISEMENEDTTTNNADFIVISEEESEERVLSSIKATLPNATFEAGGVLSISGISVKAFYTDGTESDITRQAFVDPSAVNMSVPGTYSLMVSYGGKTTTVKVTVNAKKQTQQQQPQQQQPQDTPQTPAPTVTVGKKIATKTAEYEITSVEKKTVKVVKSTVKTKSLKTLSIPKTIKYEGVSYKVTEIGKGAYKNKSKLTKVTIPSTVTKIGSSAFQGCKKLKTITIKTKSLSSIGKNAFKSIQKKATFKVPSSKLKKYKKMISKKNVGYKKTWKIKK